MKRHITTYLALVLVMLLVGVSSCDKDAKYPEMSNQETSNLVEFNRMTSEGFEYGDKIGMFSYPSESSIFGKSDMARWNIPYVQGANKLSLAEDSKLEPIYFPDNIDLLLDFVGYYPYSDKITDDGFLAIGDISDQSVNALESMLYSDNATKTERTGYSISLSFEYVMAQVIVNILYDSSIPESDRDVSKIVEATLTGDNLHTTCNFYVATGDVSAVVESDEALRATIKMKHGVATTYATVVPGIVKNIEFKIVAIGSTFRARAKDITYENGKQYTYNMTLKDSPTDPDGPDPDRPDVYLEDISAAIEDWTDGGETTVPVDPF